MTDCVSKKKEKSKESRDGGSESTSLIFSLRFLMRLLRQWTIMMERASDPNQGCKSRVFQWASFPFYSYVTGAATPRKLSHEKPSLKQFKIH